MTNANTKRWAVVIDDERRTFRTRREAREWARRIARHPANVDIRTHGGYLNVDGTPRVLDLWH